MNQKNIVLLGSTGSVGTQCLAVCRAHGFSVLALTAQNNFELLAQQAKEFSPKVVVIGNEKHYAALKELLSSTTIEVRAGAQAIVEVAALSEATIVFNSLLGIAGLRPTLAALSAGTPLALSNKEALVAGGELVMRTAQANNTPIIPVDSEHSAIWQSLQGSRREDVRSVILTASGGPFFGKTRRDLEDVTVKETLAHPNWAMGKKISVDSATLMNKGLEFIEAMWLFSLQPDQIEVVVHRQSVLHSAVDFQDGSVIGQLGVPDMAGAIQYALAYPRRLPLAVPRLNLIQYNSLTFEAPDLDTFSCLASCIKAAHLGGLYPTLVNSVNEQAVELFLKGEVHFLRIGDLVAQSLQALTLPTTITLDNIEETDKLAREFVSSKNQRK